MRGADLQALMGPLLEYCPKHNSKKNRGSPANRSITM